MEAFKEKWSQDVSPLRNVLAIIESVFDPIFDKLSSYANIKDVVSQIIEQNSKPLLLAIAELDNATELLPIMLKRSVDIDLSPELFLQLTRTPHASKVMPMILDKASAWKMELSWEIFDQALSQFLILLRRLYYTKMFVRIRVG